MSESKTGKYFKYAIGEIVLVVIGILIALSINNWNENRKDINKEQIYFKNLINDLQNQIVEIENQKNAEEKLFLDIQGIVKFINEDFPENKLTEFNKMATAIILQRNFNLFDATYQDMKSSGNLSLIKDGKLKKSLLSYYQNADRMLMAINDFSQDQLVFGDLLKKQLTNIDITQFEKVFSESKNLKEAALDLGFSSEVESKFNTIITEQLSNELNQLTLKNTVSSVQFINQVALGYLKGLKTETLDLITVLESKLK